MELIRSFLFAPGSNSNVMQKALKAGADAVIFDLEDAVAVTEKVKARDLVFEEIRKGPFECKRYVRINAWGTSWAREDLLAAVEGGIDGVMMPKAENSDDVNAVAAMIPADVDFIPLVETARGILNAFEIASSNAKISRLAFGAVDFTLDVGATYSKTGLELLYARSCLVIASRAADLYPPIDTVYPDLTDLNGLESELSQIKTIGMFGKLAIHPKQLNLIHHTFTPTESEVEIAQKITSAFEESEKIGCASMRVDGKFVDYPVFLKAQQIISLAEYLRHKNP